MRHCVNLLALRLRQKRFKCSGHIHTHHTAHTTHNTHIGTHHAPRVTEAHHTCTAYTYHTPTVHRQHAHTPYRTHTPPAFCPIPLPHTHPHCQFLPLFLSFMAGPSLYANLTDPSTLCRNFCSEDQCFQIPALKQYL